MSSLLNKLYRFNIWLDKNETTKFILMLSLVLLSSITIRSFLFIGLPCVILLSVFALLRIYMIEGHIKFNRSKYQPPTIGDIIIIQKEFFYDGAFKKYINHSDPAHKPNWWEIRKGTEWTIVDVKEITGDWTLTLIDNWWGGTYLMDLNYLQTKKYWETKANIRDKKLRNIL